MSIIKEFRDFAVKGNVVDLAVGVIIGAAFGKIVSSLVNDIVMPPIGLIVGNVDFSDLVWTLQEKSETQAAVVVKYGLFINQVVDFTIVAFAIFLMVKVINRLHAKQTQQIAAAEEAKPTTTETLLREIRDLLKTR